MVFTPLVVNNDLLSSDSFAEKSPPCTSVFYLESSLPQKALRTLNYDHQPFGRADTDGWITMETTGYYFVTLNVIGGFSDSKLSLNLRHSRFNFGRIVTENKHTSSKGKGLFDSCNISASFIGFFMKGDKLCVELNEGVISAFDGNKSVTFLGHSVTGEENNVAFYAERTMPLLSPSKVTYNFETGHVKDGCFVAPKNGKKYVFYLW